MKNVNMLVEALQRIAYARDYNAEFGEYPRNLFDGYECFDDWAADIAQAALECNNVIVRKVDVMNKKGEY